MSSNEFTFTLSSVLFFQLNPSKLEKNEDVTMNLTHLLNILSELVEKIFMAAEILPAYAPNTQAHFVCTSHLWILSSLNNLMSFATEH